MDIRLRQQPIQQIIQSNNKQFHQKLPEQSHFKNILNKASIPKISKHANIRMQERNLSLNNEQLIELSEQIQKANQKGVKESVVLTDAAAFIVSIKNNTIITAMDRNEAQQQIFTNIDGAILLKK